MADTAFVKLAALDEDDLSIVSAHLQDAVLRVGDIRWLKQDAKLVFVANRFDHMSDKSGDGERRQCGFQASRVKRVSSRKISLEDKTAILCLLAINFIKGDTAPEGTIELAFAGGGTLRVEVECIEVAIADLTGPWAARARPDHDGEKEAGS